jgi:hypothetical protein
MKRRKLRCVLHNLLGTFASRHTAYNGYFLFGFIIEEFEEAGFDLLDESVRQPYGPLAEAERIAKRKFDEQLVKAGLDRSVVREARLSMSRLPEPVQAPVWDWFDNPKPGAGKSIIRTGYQLRFRAAASTDSGQQ